MLENFAKVVKPSSEEAELLTRIDWDRLPRHVAVIMDGNGRWAKMRGRPRIFGHQEGAESVRALLDASVRMGIKALTLYAFSTENWKRPADEVGALMGMLKRYLRSELKEVHKQGIRFQPIGDISRLAPDIQKELADAVELTKNNEGTTLSVALSYGSRQEILDAAKRTAKKLLADGRSIDEMTEADLEQNLYTHGLPEVDLMIRTSGEMRISNFLLWQLAYSEIHVTPIYFPDFRLKQYLEAIIDYQKRERRFGDVTASAK